jgi:pyruvate/2-oxoacid:ferredoxin oxidoreductase beta subunit
VTVCPAKDKSNASRKALNMAVIPERTKERKQYEFFLALPNPDRTTMKAEVKSSQFAEPLFEYSGACAGCGETPYLKLLTQLYGDRLVIANATGCSSIYGGNLPTTPLHAPIAMAAARPGPTRCSRTTPSTASDSASPSTSRPHRAPSPRRPRAEHRRRRSSRNCSSEPQRNELGHRAQRERVLALRTPPAHARLPEARRLESVADFLVRKSVWIVGGDGWAYDIGYGGLDHVISTGLDVNILVLDTEVYSNTGGQMSKATPFGATAKFAIAGKMPPKEGSRPDGDDLRQCLCRAGRLRRQGFADGQGLRGSREFSRRIAHHRLQPLHRPRLRHAPGPRAAEARRRIRSLAALPLRPAPCGGRQSADANRQRRAESPGEGLRAQRTPLPHEAGSRSRLRGGAQQQVDARVALYNKLATIGAPQPPAAISPIQAK